MQIVKRLKTSISTITSEKEVEFIVEKRPTHYAFLAFELGGNNTPYAVHTGGQKYIAQIWKRYTNKKF